MKTGHALSGIICPTDAKVQGKRPDENRKKPQTKAAENRKLANWIEHVRYATKTAAKQVTKHFRKFKKTFRLTI